MISRKLKNIIFIFFVIAEFALLNINFYAEAKDKKAKASTTQQNTYWKSFIALSPGKYCFSYTDDTPDTVNGYNGTMIIDTNNNHIAIKQKGIIFNSTSRFELNEIGEGEINDKTITMKSKNYVSREFTIGDKYILGTNGIQNEKIKYKIVSCDKIEPDAK